MQDSAIKAYICKTLSFFRIFNFEDISAKFRLLFCMLMNKNLFRYHFYKLLNPYVAFCASMINRVQGAILKSYASSCSSSNASNDLPDIYFSKRSSFPSITVSHCSDSVKFVTHILGYSSTFCLITISAESFSLIS